MYDNWNFLDDNDISDTYDAEFGPGAEFDEEYDDSDEEDFEEIVERLRIEQAEIEAEEKAALENMPEFEKVLKRLNESVGAWGRKTCSHDKLARSLKELQDERRRNFDKNEMIYLEEMEESDLTAMDDDELLKKAHEYRANDDVSSAIALLEFGLCRNDTDVRYLSTLINYNNARKRYDECRRFRAILDEIPKKQWSCYAFRAVICALIEEDAVANEAETRMLIEEFAQHYPDMEFAGCLEYELDMVLGNRTAAIDALRVTIAKVRNAPSCCRRLSAVLMDKGEYEEARKVCIRSLESSCKDYRTIYRTVQHYRLIKCEEGLMWKRSMDNNADPSAEEIRKILLAYEGLIEAWEWTYLPMGRLRDERERRIIFAIRNDLEPIMYEVYRDRNLLKSMLSLYG